MTRLNRWGDAIEDDEATEAQGPSPRQLARKGRPVAGLARTLQELGGKCPDPACARFICRCDAA